MSSNLAFTRGAVLANLERYECVPSHTFVTSSVVHSVRQRISGTALLLVTLTVLSNFPPSLLNSDCCYALSSFTLKNLV